MILFLTCFQVNQQNEYLPGLYLPYWYSIILIDYITDDYITVANLIANFLMHGYKILQLAY